MQTTSVWKSTEPQRDSQKQMEGRQFKNPLHNRMTECG